MRLFTLALGLLSQWSCLGQLQDTVAEHDQLPVAAPFSQGVSVVFVCGNQHEHAYKQQLIPQRLQCQEIWHKAGKCNKGKLMLVYFFASKLTVTQVG